MLFFTFKRLFSNSACVKIKPTLTLRILKSRKKKDKEMAAEEDTVVREGLVEIYQPSSVFYNPVQEFNRDLTIAVISEFAQDHFKYVQAKEEKLNKKRNAENKKAEMKVKEGECDDLGRKNDTCELESGDIHAKKEKLNQKDSVKKGQEQIESDVISMGGDLGGDEKLEAGVRNSKGLTILEGLAASGLRSIRFAKEIPGVQSITANDFDKTAVEYIERNIEHNNVQSLVKANLGDASLVMYQQKKFSERFDVIDLDPYGSPSHFLDATVQSVRDGGLLCVTCTDMGVLCGNGSEACYAKYGAMSLKSKFCHEMALRIVLQSIESHANRYGRYIKPLISISADFYVRVFVQVFSGQNIVKQSVTKMSLIYHCGGCGSFALQPMATKTPTENSNFKFSPACGPPVSDRCEHCNSRYHLGGPMWAEPLYDTDFIERVIKRVQNDPSRFGTSERITGLLTVMTEELQDVPLYYVVDHLFSIVHLSTPKLVEIRSAILNAGYRVSLSHAAKNSLKTSAPMSVLWDIIRCWAKTHPVNEKHLKPGTIVNTILSKKAVIEASFDLHADAAPKSQGMLRWQSNPERDWGPKPKAKRGGVETLEERRLRGIEKAKEKKESKRKAQGEVDYKQFACKRFKHGKCELGEKCQYSHNKKEEDAEMTID